MSKQLGLKLESQPVPVESLLIESVNRKPPENPTGVGTALALAAAKFEAATIKPADPNGRPFQGLLYTGGSQMRAGGTLKSMIALSMQISPNIANDTMIGLPKSAETQAWDITAKVPSTGEGTPNVVRGRPQPPPFSVGLEMLRGLLVDSFELKFHTENREVTVYALTVAGGKPKLAQAAESDRAGCKPDPNAPKPYTNIPRDDQLQEHHHGGTGTESATAGRRLYRSPGGGRDRLAGRMEFPDRLDASQSVAGA